MKYKTKKIITLSSLSKILIDMEQQITKSGTLKISDKEIQLPDSLSLEIEYKEKTDKNKFALKLKWHNTRSVEDENIKTESALNGSGLNSRKEIKTELGSCWRDIKGCLDSDNLPGNLQIDKFDKLSKAYSKYCSANYLKEYQVFLKTVSDFINTVNSNDLLKAKDLKEKMQTLKSDCHKNHK